MSGKIKCNKKQNHVGYINERREYTPPRILTAERLEATAGTCPDNHPGGGGPGKTVGGGGTDCTSLGS